MKPYQTMPIRECGEPLTPIPGDRLRLVSPHPYQALGAPYGERSPFWVRQGVVEALVLAQELLEQQRPGWHLQIFDAYRPIPVQQFMVDYAFAELAAARGLVVSQLQARERKALQAEVMQFWAVPSADPATPPPHSTGAAVDVTLLDAEGQPVDMGSPIDEISPRSLPDHFAQASDPAGRQAHAHRQQLYGVMAQAGFRRHPNEWWHFSLGDQFWAWLEQEATGKAAIARYGRAE
ncbi:M15 family metallopeptidase [Geitlerinema sp. PCC 7407]|uniref:M15 family metallopeptidase n=1 Tax=Geitlerinema sp. PCC 7407 TaxID=1173025 RepID=UPI00029FC838|nr:M15 family metallopeptidase [Geitlerinema sp. PCC 7407]AFY65732.1 D-Ala-D-Ala dipeptidase [Geitlerinema sp. PCC 7407]